MDLRKNTEKFYSYAFSASSSFKGFHPCALSSNSWPSRVIRGKPNWFGDIIKSAWRLPFRQPFHGRQWGRWTITHNPRLRSVHKCSVVHIEFFCHYSRLIVDRNMFFVNSATHFCFGYRYAVIPKKVRPIYPSWRWGFIPSSASFWMMSRRASGFSWRSRRYLPEKSGCKVFVTTFEHWPFRVPKAVVP